MGIYQALILFLITLPAAMAESSSGIVVPPLIREGVLRAGYEIRCPDETAPVLHSLLARFKGESESYRIPVFRNLNTLEFPVSYSRDARDLELTPLMRKGCQFHLSSTELTFAETRLDLTSPDIQARIHSPVLIPRSDQLRKRWNDVPVRLYYSFIPHSDPTRRVIRYTAIFTDEDNLQSFRSLRRQMAMYGRRLDFEWIYEVHLDIGTGRALARYYQGDPSVGIGHSRKPFHGKFLANSQHPILHTITRHNVFSDRVEAPYGWDSNIRIFLPLHSRIQSPEARENVLLSEPWLMQAGDEELRKRRSTVPLSTSHFYVRIRGRANTLPLQPYLRWEGNMRPLGFQITRLGLDLFGLESWIAFRLKSSDLEELRTKPWTLVWKDRSGLLREGPVPVRGYHLNRDAAGLYRWGSSSPAEESVLIMLPDAI